MITVRRKAEEPKDPSARNRSKTLPLLLAITLLPAALHAADGQVQAVKAPAVAYPVYRYLPEGSDPAATETTLSAISREIAGKVFYELKEESGSASSARVAVVNAVPLSDFKRETEFGRLLGEYLLTDLADRGLRVNELRLGREITILPQTGEFIMTRNIGELATAQPALDHIVVSTFSNTRRTLIVQGRLVELSTGIIKTSWRYGLPLTRELLALFHGPGQHTNTIAVKAME
ncbi:MAG: FlgO family outer membrane protein [Thermodesulfobacteriota bacterium]